MSGARPNTVLIVDDHATIRFLLRTLVEKAGFIVCAEAPDGAKAIEEAKRTRPDLILLDLVMPTLDGVEAASALKELMPQVPIILFTLHDDGIGRSFAKTLGVDMIMAKSDGMTKLVPYMRTLLNLTKRERGELC